MKVYLNPKSYLPCTFHTIIHISSDQSSFLYLSILSSCNYQFLIIHLCYLQYYLITLASLCLHMILLCFIVQVVSEPPCYPLVVFWAINAGLAVTDIPVSLQGITHSPPLLKCLPGEDTSQRRKFVRSVLAAIIILIASSSLLLYFPYVSFIGCLGSSWFWLSAIIGDILLSLGSGQNFTKWLSLPHRKHLLLPSPWSLN